jgi:hypothetical protein
MKTKEEIFQERIESYAQYNYKARKIAKFESEVSDQEDICKTLIKIDENFNHEFPQKIVWVSQFDRSKFDFKDKQLVYFVLDDKNFKLSYTVGDKNKLDIECNLHCGENALNFINCEEYVDFNNQEMLDKIMELNTIGVELIKKMPEYRLLCQTSGCEVELGHGLSRIEMEMKK